jgi:inner membrane protein
MVEDGVHVLFGLSLVLVLFRARRPEPYLVAALAAAFPDIDIVVFDTLVEMGYLSGVIWVHRGLTHSLAFGIVLIAVLSFFGPWPAAAVGFFSHVLVDSLTGGVQLLAPFDSGRYGLAIDWFTMNALATVVSVTILLLGLCWLQYVARAPAGSRPSPNTVLDRFK